MQGELQNSPSISFIYSIKTNCKKVVQGDLYLARDKKDLEEAINNGAFAVVYDFEVTSYDNEIAWIKVDSCKKALIKIFRYKLASLDLKAFHCEDTVFDLLNIYKNTNSEKDIFLLSNNLDEVLKNIDLIKKNDIIVSNDPVLLDKIYPNNQIFDNLTFEVSNLTSHSIFECSFTYDNTYFNKIKISSLYIQDFLKVFNFFDENLDLSKLKNFDCFKPIFVDKFMNILDYGKSDKFIISQKNPTLVDLELNYIKNRYKYAKTIVISKTFIEGLNSEQFVISKVNTLKDFLLKKKFNCAYLIGYDISKIETTLNRCNLQKTLL